MPWMATLDIFASVIGTDARYVGCGPGHSGARMA